MSYRVRQSVNLALGLRFGHCPPETGRPRGVMRTRSYSRACSPEICHPEASMGLAAQDCSQTNGKFYTDNGAASQASSSPEFFLKIIVSFARAEIAGAQWRYKR